ncbi:ENTH domain-containing protein [Aphelenchoides fujianensis]|nr:ENTH domain-containing protein [Aphelenchoides fujianensis]
MDHADTILAKAVATAAEANQKNGKRMPKRPPKGLKAPPHLPPVQLLPLHKPSPKILTIVHNDSKEVVLSPPPVVVEAAPQAGGPPDGDYIEPKVEFDRLSADKVVYQKSGAGKTGAKKSDAHKKNDRKHSPHYKSRMCDHLRTKGECKFGLKCWYTHGAPELRNVPLLNCNAELELWLLNEVIRALPPSSSRKAAEDKCQQLYHEILQYQLQPPPAPFGHHFHAPSAYAGAVHAIDASGRFMPPNTTIHQMMRRVQAIRPLQRAGLQVEVHGKEERKRFLLSSLFLPTTFPNLPPPTRAPVSIRSSSVPPESFFELLDKLAHRNILEMKGALGFGREKPLGDPDSDVLNFLAAQTRDSLRFPEVMCILWKRLCDPPKSWRHVYKSLIVLEYLLLHGNPLVAEQANGNVLILNRLANFQFFEGAVDHGLVVREAVDRILKLLADPAQLKEQREKAAAIRARCTSTSSTTSKGAEIKQADRTKGRRSELLDAAPKTAADEKAVLQIALAPSRETAVQQTVSRQSVGDGTVHLEADYSYHVHQTAVLPPPPSTPAAHQPLTVETHFAPPTTPAVPQITAELIDVFDSLPPAAPPPSAGLDAADPFELAADFRAPPTAFTASTPLPAAGHRAQQTPQQPAGDWNPFAFGPTGGHFAFPPTPQPNPFFSHPSAV